MCFLKKFNLIGKRILESNNRLLGTLFGCASGFIIGVILVIQHSASLAIVGNPILMPYKIIGIILAAGTGGNLCSYIGASIDILTGEKTLIDLVKYFYYCSNLKKIKQIS